LKKITAYVNTLRVHWLVEELEAVGIKEVMVTEYFSPSSQISRMELFSKDDEVETVRGIVHRVGTTGSVGDHSFFVEEFDPKLPGQIPLGKRTSKLEESHVKQLVNFMLRGTQRKITTAFLMITLCVVVVGIFIFFRANTFRRATAETMGSIHLISETVGTVESAMLEEMLAAERLHRGETSSAILDFHSARTNLRNAMSILKEASISSRTRVDSLIGLEHQFHRVVGGMFEIVDSLSRYGDVRHHLKVLELSKSHARIMASLDDRRLQLLGLLGSIEMDARELVVKRQKELDRLTKEVMVSMLLLAAAAIGVTVMIWRLVERNVARPIQRLMEGAKTIDSGQLR
jgi:nitrogen regulatory protein PII